MIFLHHTIILAKGYVRRNWFFLVIRANMTVKLTVTRSKFEPQPKNGRFAPLILRDNSRTTLGVETTKTSLEFPEAAKAHIFK